MKTVDLGQGLQTDMGQHPPHTRRCWNLHIQPSARNRCCGDIRGVLSQEMPQGSGGLVPQIREKDSDSLAGGLALGPRKVSTVARVGEDCPTCSGTLHGHTDPHTSGNRKELILNFAKSRSFPQGQECGRMASPYLFQ